MSKFATKAAANMFCQARYEAAKSNERLSSREGAAEEIGIDRTRLARIELGSTIPYQEEVLLMADCYKAPELKGNYCREMCPLGKNMPKIENAGLDRISLRMLSSLKKINEATELWPSTQISRPSLTQSFHLISRRDGMGKASIQGFLMSSTNRWIQSGLHLASLLSHCTTSWIRLK